MLIPRLSPRAKGGAPLIPSAPPTPHLPSPSADTFSFYVHKLYVRSECLPRTPPPLPSPLVLVLDLFWCICYMLLLGT